MNQLQNFERVWGDFSNPMNAMINPNSLIEDEGYAITLTLFVEGKVNDNLINTINNLREISPIHRYSKVDQLHITLKGIKIVPLQFNKQIIDKYITKIEDILKKIKPFKLQVRGLNHFPNVIFAQVFSADNKLFELHNKLCEVLPSSQPQFEKDNYIPHIAIVTEFKNKPDKLFEEIKKYRDTDLGELTVNKIQLTKWKFPPQGVSQVIRTFELSNL